MTKRLFENGHFWISKIFYKFDFTDRVITYIPNDSSRQDASFAHIRFWLRHKEVEKFRFETLKCLSDKAIFACKIGYFQTASKNSVFTIGK